MTHTEQATQRALACPHTAKTFATLDRHAAAGTWSHAEALRLLRNNARDATPHTPSAVRDAVAERLLDAWNERRGLDVGASLQKKCATTD